MAQVQIDMEHELQQRVEEAKEEDIQAVMRQEAVMKHLGFSPQTAKVIGFMTPLEKREAQVDWHALLEIKQQEQSIGLKQAEACQRQLLTGYTPRKGLDAGMPTRVDIAVFEQSALRLF